MKLYTEEQVKHAMIEARVSPWLETSFLLADYTPIELPSDDDICDEAESIAHNYFVMQRNHYEGLEEGAKRMAYWLMKKIKPQDDIGIPLLNNKTMADITFRRGDRVYDEKYGNGVIDYLENHIIVEFRMGQYIAYDLKGYRHFPEEKQPALFKR